MNVEGIIQLAEAFIKVGFSISLAVVIYKAVSIVLTRNKEIEEKGADF